MRISIFAILFGAVMALTGCPGDEADDTAGMDDTGDSTYEGMRVRSSDVGWRIPAKN